LIFHLSFAHSPWIPSPQLPDDPKRLCIVEVHHARFDRKCFELLHWDGLKWRFQDNTALTNNAVVLRWALIES